MTTPFIPGTPLHLVGRDRELRILRAHLATACAGQGNLVLIGGEAGIGKTSLAEALCREAAEQGALVLTGRCFDFAETPAYGPWLYLFERYHMDDAVPALPAAFSQRGIVGEVASQADLFRQVLDFFAALSNHYPIVLLLDDLHWADPASLDLLRFLAQSVAQRSMLILVTYRSDELSRQHPLYTLLPLLVREAPTERLDPHTLDDAAVHALIRERYHLTESERTRLVAYVQARAEGNAFFLGELLRSLEETSTLHRESVGWTLRDLAHTTVPPLLRQVIDGRLGRLDAESQRLLTIAAVIGQEVPLDVWATVAQAGEEALLDVIEQAVRARLLTEMPSKPRAQFAHALVREAIYEGEMAIRRRRLHRLAGDALAALAHPDPDAVAYHFQQADDGRAAEWFIAAGEQAQRAWAWLTAADRYEVAASLMEANGGDAGERAWLLFRLALMRRYADTAQALVHLDAAGRLAAQTDDRLLSAQVIFYRGNLHCLAGRLGQGIAEMAEGVAALAALPPVDTSLRPGIAIVRVTGARGTHFTWLGNVGRFAEARALGEEYVAEVLADASEGMASTRYARGVGGLQHVYAHQGEVEAAHRAFIYACDIHRAGGSYLLLGVSTIYALLWVVLPYRADDVAERRRLAAEAEDAWASGSGARTAVPARFARLPVLFVEGEWEVARTLALAGHTESGGYVLSKLFAFTTLGPLAQAQGDTELARWLVREWLPDGPATPPGNTFYAVTILQRMAAAMAIDTGDVVIARGWLEAHDRWLAWSGAVLGQAERHLAWARFYRAIGNIELADQRAAQALAHASEPRQPLALIAAERLVGELDTAAKRFAGAARHLTEALTLANACQAPYEQALTLLANAELQVMTGEHAAALGLLDKVRAICTSLGAKPTLARTDALAATLSTVPHMPPIFPSGLSAREVEVLRLIAAGRTNAEIADALFLSKRTVQVHVAHILAKTDTNNRAAAASFALRHRLA